MWDSINKAAAVVTLITAVPAFLTLAGLSTIAGVVLGIISVSSLTFALYRIGKLKLTAKTLNKFIAEESEVLRSFKDGVSSIEPWKKLIDELSQYLLKEEKEEFSIHLWILDVGSDEHEILARLFLSSGNEKYGEKLLSLSSDGAFKLLWSKMEPELPNVAWPDYTKSILINRKFTNAIIPICNTIDQEYGEYSILGFIAIDGVESKHLKKRYLALFNRVADLYHLMFMHKHMQMELERDGIN